MMTIQCQAFQANTVIICILMAAVMYCTAGPATASDSLSPGQDMAIRFDLSNHTMHAASTITVPAGVGLTVQLAALDVSRLSINGRDRESSPDDGILPIPAAPTEQIVTIAYSLTVPAPAPSRNLLIDPRGITLAGRWHPTADRDMRFRLTAAIPLEFAAVSEADEIITFEEETRKEVLFRFPHPMANINFAAGPYIVVEEAFGDNRILASYFFAEDQDLAASYREKAREYLTRYQELLGPYPYQRFAVVENRLPTGFAMPTYTLLGQAVLRLPFIKDTSLGHEILHAWFGNGVRPSLAEGNWVEGLATYLADHAQADDRGEGAAYRKEQLVRYQSYIHRDNELSLADFRGGGHQDPAERPARAVGYGKGAMVFHMLRQRLGKEVFHEGLRQFYRNMRYKRAGWSELQTAFENAANTGLQNFFDQWLRRSDIPRLEVVEPTVTEEDGRPLLSFTLHQDNTSPYRLAVPLLIHTGRENVRRTVEVSDTDSSLSIPLPGRPVSLVIDPDYHLMRGLTTAEFPPTWSRFAGADHKLAILSPHVERENFEPLITKLEQLGSRVSPLDEVETDRLPEQALIFLGTTPLSRSLFARPDHAVDGFTVDVRPNPLNPEQVAVLVTAGSTGAVEAGARKLSHYGKYSYLHFDERGVNLEKRIAPADNGMRTELAKMPRAVATEAALVFEEIIDRLASCRVVYIGESHTSYEDHLLQLQIIRALFDRDPNLAVGMEMFNRSVQPVLDDYLTRRLDEKQFLKKSAYFEQWRFDYRLYRDIINFARRQQLPLVALNLDKEIVGSVFKKGNTSGLSETQAASLPADRRLDMPGYRDRLAEVFGLHGQDAGAGAFAGFLQSQALWDETMAETAADYLQANPDKRLVILAGRGHVLKENAIPPRLARRLPVRQAVVVNSDGREIEAGQEDYLFFTPPAELPPKPLLGVLLTEADHGEGAVVTGLSPGGGAEKAGIRANDIIIGIDDERITDAVDVTIAMLDRKPGQKVTVRLKREHWLFGEREEAVEVELSASQSPH